MERLIFIRQEVDPKLNWIILGLRRYFEIEILEEDLKPEGRQPPYAIVVVADGHHFPRAMAASSHLPVIWFNIGNSHIRKMPKLRVFSKSEVSAKRAHDAIKEVIETSKKPKQLRMPNF